MKFFQISSTKVEEVKTNLITIGQIYCVLLVQFLQIKNKNELEKKINKFPATKPMRKNYNMERVRNLVNKRLLLYKNLYF